MYEAGIVNVRKQFVTAEKENDLIAQRHAYEPVLKQWFGDDPQDAQESTRRFKSWFNPSDDNDAIVRERFFDILQRAFVGECDDWTTSARGSLALVILFDQVTRTLYRGLAEAFACDERAMAIAESAIARGFDQDLSFIERAMLYIPFEHGENLESQNRCVEYFQLMDSIAPSEFKSITQSCVVSGMEHREVIRRFGRFPHRNRPLGRVSTKDELAWIVNHHGWGQAEPETEKGDGQVKN